MRVDTAIQPKNFSRMNTAGRNKMRYIQAVAGKFLPEFGHVYARRSQWPGALEPGPVGDGAHRHGGFCHPDSYWPKSNS